MSDSTLFSRPATANDDKLTQRIDIPVSDELRDALKWMATAQGMPLSQYAREVLQSHAFGEFGRMRSIVQDRLRSDDGTNLR